MSKAVCLTCTDKTKQRKTVTRRSQYRLPSYIAQNQGDIPEWFRRANIYSPVAPTLTCNPKYNPWKNELIREEVPRYTNDSLTIQLSQLREIDPGIPTDTEVVFYMWAAKPRCLHDTTTHCAEYSYGNFANSGVFISKEDKVEFRFANPVPYREDGVLYPPHIHFTRLMPDDTWQLRAWAVNVPPVLEYRDFERVRKSGKYLVVNALDSAVEDDIPDTLRIGSRQRPAQIQRMMGCALKGVAKPYEYPIALYCAHSTCNSSHRLMKKLLMLGYSNQLLYPGGIEDWQSHQGERIRSYLDKR